LKKEGKFRRAARRMTKRGTPIGQKRREDFVRRLASKRKKRESIVIGREKVAQE